MLGLRIKESFRLEYVIIVLVFLIIVYINYLFREKWIEYKNKGI